MMGFIWKRKDFLKRADLHNICKRIPHIVKVSAKRLLSPLQFFSLLLGCWFFFLPSCVAHGLSMVSGSGYDHSDEYKQM